MNRLAKNLLLILLGLIVFGLINECGSGEFRETRIRSAWTKDRTVFRHVEGYRKPNIRIQPEQPIPVSELLDQDNLAWFKDQRYHLEDYAAYLRGDDLLVYRKEPSLDPAMILKDATRVPVFLYDPTNGVESQGFRFMLIKVK